jgi:hypothetical protein
VDQNDQGGILDKAKEALSNLFGGGDDTGRPTIDSMSSETEPTAEYPTETSAPSGAGSYPEYKTGTDQDSATGDYPTATGAGTGVTDPSYSDPSYYAASSTTEYSPQYKSGTDQDSMTGGEQSAPGAGTGMGLSDSDVAQLDLGTPQSTTRRTTTDTEVVPTSEGFDTDTESPVGARSGAYASTSGETAYDAGAGTGSSLSDSGTSFRPAGETTAEYGLERETIQRPDEDDALDAP